MRAMCGMMFKHKKKFKGLRQTLGLSGKIVQLALTNNMHWYGHVLRSESVLVQRRVLEFKLKVKRGMGSVK